MNDWPICCGHDSILELLVIGRKKRVGSTKVEQKENLNNELTRNSSMKKRERKDRDLCYIRRRMTHTGPDRTDAAEYKRIKKAENTSGKLSAFPVSGNSFCSGRLSCLDLLSDAISQCRLNGRRC